MELLSARSIRRTFLALALTMGASVCARAQEVRLGWTHDSLRAHFGGEIAGPLTFEDDTSHSEWYVISHSFMWNQLGDWTIRFDSTKRIAIASWEYHGDEAARKRTFDKIEKDLRSKLGAPGVHIKDTAQTRLKWQSGFERRILSNYDHAVIPSPTVRGLGKGVIYTLKCCEQPLGSGHCNSRSPGFAELNED